MSKTKDRDEIISQSMLHLMEVRTSRNMLNGLMVMNMITKSVIKHLESYSILETIDVNSAHNVCQNLYC